MAYRVLVTDKLSEEGLALLRAEKDVEVVVDSKLAKDPKALKEALKDADGIAIRSGTQLTAEVLEGQTRLKAIVRAGVGVDNIDVPAATRQGVVVMNTPGGNTISTAEQTMALMLALSRNTTKADASLKAGKWDRNSLTGVQLEGKTLGVVGLGRVGLAVAQRALGFEMKVLGYDPLLSAEKAQEHGVELVPKLDDLWPQCDYITLHTPLTPETRHVVSAAAIASMKPSVRIINCARGGLIDDAALLEALNSGKVAGAAVDVFETEPPPADDPIVAHPKTVVTPHLGASTEEAQVNVAVEAARLLCDYLIRGQVRFSVNTPTLDRAEMQDLRGHLDLAWRLGLLHAQMDRGAITKAVLTYRGDAANKNTKLLTACFAAGLMEASLAQSVNLVNALPFARERGLIIEEKSVDAPSDFGTLIQAEVTTDRKTYVAAGTLFGKEFLRLVRLGSFQLDAHLDGPLLTFTHNDRPGLIGFLGTTLGDRGVNIAQMNVGREKPGGEAIGVVNLDGIPTQDDLDAVAKHPDILSVRLIKLPAQGELPSWLGS
ncbi:phosphoglycerate dehydrogenase [Planctomyces sp. SH-PL62]|uniref:phosphoglycerate dehydrogenase n=1 Tax=Planctomyces sp. SH-PL62 TaxID=1636152 RepID=UPI00078BB869|nr:phosphoglycerate dehydrogenase [Planctomyces sp. SH-PL62]AMV38255.1 D-3-phosphoglycerate dehydrogenase [Planctomyces sp. SH-PL62]